MLVADNLFVSYDVSNVVVVLNIDVVDLLVPITVSNVVVVVVDVDVDLLVNVDLLVA
jgi:hypothetical protein